MKRKTSERIFEPSTKDIFISLSSCPKWVRLLEGNGKAYQEFLSRLIEVDFFAGKDERITVKMMSESFGLKRELITKWIGEMYEDVFELNNDKPELFQTEGTLHEFYIKGLATSTSFKLWLKSTPRLYEHINFDFLHAKLELPEFLG